MEGEIDRRREKEIEEGVDYLHVPTLKGGIDRKK